MIDAVCHTAIAALGTLAIYKLGGSLAAFATIGVCGALISLPSVVLAGGTWLACHGITAIVSSISLGSFGTLAYGMASLGGGYILLEKYDVTIIGLLERGIYYAAYFCAHKFYG